MPRLRLGVVGCGDIAGHLALVSRLVRPVQLAACCDLDGERAATFARRWGIPQVYTDYSAMLAGASMEAVYLAVPHYLHTGMIRQALEAGKHVFSEKPVTCRVAEARPLIELAARQGLKFGVNYQYRYDSACYALARAVQSGELGAIHYLRANLAWQRDEDYFTNAAWHARLDQACGGTLLTQGSHLLDILLWAHGGQPRRASGVTARRKFGAVDVEDLALGVIEMDDGALLQIASSMVATPEQPLSLEVYGARGTAQYTDKPRPRLRFAGVNIQARKLPGWGVHALQRSLAGFTRWVLSDEPYLIPAESALPALAAVEAIYRAAQSGQTEPVEI